MSCSTIFYKRVLRSESEAIEIAKKNISIKLQLFKEEKDCAYKYQFIYLFSKYLQNIEDEIYVFPHESIDGNIQTKNDYDENMSIWDFQSNGHITDYYINEKYYQEVSEYYNTFRSDYREENLFSLEETLDYIKKNNCYITDIEIEQLKEFWNEYPDGLINFC